MSETIYAQEDGVIFLKPGRKAWGVDIPAYVYDLWMPLIGLDVVGVYGVLWRLARGGITKGLSLKELAKKTKKGDKTIAKYAEILEDCGFIKTSVPSEKLRRLGFTTAYTILDPPDSVPADKIEKYAPDGDYESLCPWLIDIEESESDEDDSRHLTTVPSSNDDLYKSLNDDLIEPSSIEPSSSLTIQHSLNGGYQAIRRKRQEQGIDPRGQTENDEAAEKQHMESHPLSALIIENTGSKHLTDAMLKKLFSEPFWGYNPGTKTRHEFSSPIALWEEDTYYRDWVRNVCVTVMKQYTQSRSDAVKTIRNGSNFLEWRNKRSPAIQETHNDKSQLYPVREDHDLKALQKSIQKSREERRP